MEYSKAMEQLASLGRFGSKPGLVRIETLLKKMGNPQNELKFIHVAGTNGKGSTTTMLANILSHSGYVTGLFISPYILCFRDRMQINGEMISEKEFGECAAYVYQFVDFNNKEDKPSQFEIIMAIAFEWYKRKKCDYVCLEVGVGGRLDSTNVISTAILQVITSIGLDHTAILGDTIEKVATEKAGIIKAQPTVIYPIQDEGANRVLQACCQKINSTWIKPDLQALQIIDADWRAESFIYEGKTYHKSLMGEFQVYNCITVIEAAKELVRQGLHLTEEDIQYGIGHTYFPARMEVLSKKPLIILDGAHNPNGAQALEYSLKKLKGTSLTIVMGVLADKEYDEILKMVGSYAEHFVAVQPNMPQAVKAEALKEQAKKYCHQVTAYEVVEEAIHKVVADMDEGDTLVVCGSLYLASEVRPILLQLISRSDEVKE